MEFRVSVSISNSILVKGHCVAFDFTQFTCRYLRLRQSSFSQTRFKQEKSTFHHSIKRKSVEVSKWTSFELFCFLNYLNLSWSLDDWSVLDESKFVNLNSPTTSNLGQDTWTNWLLCPGNLTKHRTSNFLVLDPCLNFSFFFFKKVCLSANFVKPILTLVYGFIYKLVLLWCFSLFPERS